MLLADENLKFFVYCIGKIWVLPMQKRVKFLYFEKKFFMPGTEQQQLYPENQIQSLL